MKKKFLSIIFIFVFVLLPTWQIMGQRRTTVFLESAETLSFDQSLRNNAQLLKGNVRFRHDNALLYCDSAYFYEKTNSLDAFGNVRIIQADTLFIYGDKLFYDGNNRLAKMRNNVRMKNRNAILTTQQLDYNTQTNIGYFFENATLTDNTNVLVSKFGEYITRENLIKFKTNVVLTNPEFILYSDTLHYHTNTAIATIVGPSTIISDSTTIYTEKGWYNTKTENAQLLKNALISHKNGRKIAAENIHYDKINGNVNAYRNVLLSDSVQQISITGNKASYFEKEDKGFVTQQAVFREHASADTLFLSADTLWYRKIEDSYLLQGHHHVRFWHKDIQGVSDSISYLQSDSILILHKSPILWNELNQIVGNTIRIKMKNDNVDRVYVDDNALIIAEEDENSFNQIAGRNMIGYMQDGRLRKISVSGSAQTIYYVKDKDNAIGTNKAESAYLTIFLNAENQAEKIVMSPQSGGILYPSFKNDDHIVKLSSFILHTEKRPKNQFDIFRKK